MPHIAIINHSTVVSDQDVEAMTAALQKQGAENEMLGEILAIVGLFNQTNALAEGYQVVPDILPQG